MHTRFHRQLCYVRILVSQLKYDDFDYIYEEFVLHVPAEDREEKPDTIRKWKEVLPRVIDIVAYKERCCVQLCAFNGWIALTGPEQTDIHTVVIAAVVEDVKNRREAEALRREKQKEKRAKDLKKRGKGVCYVEQARISFLTLLPPSWPIGPYGPKTVIPSHYQHTKNWTRAPRGFGTAILIPDTACDEWIQQQIESGVLAPPSILHLPPDLYGWAPFITTRYMPASATADIRLL